MKILSGGEKFIDYSDFETALYKKFDRVSTISQRMVERLIQKGVNSDPIVLFPNWVDTKIFILKQKITGESKTNEYFRDR